jgi:hypothetical protein
MTVKNNHPIDSLSPVLGMLIEVLDPFKGYIIIGPAIGSRLDDPGLGEATFRIPRREVVDALDDEKWRDTKAIACHALNRSRPFAIARLELLASATSIGPRNDHTAAYDSHHKARLVEVVEVAFLDPVLGTHVGHKPKPILNQLRIFAEGSLEVVCARKARLKLWAALYEAVGPMLTDALSVTRREEEIRHIFNTIDPGWKSSRI